MVAEYAGGQITRYRAEYFHQDHLGNTRLVFSDFNQDGIVGLGEDDPATPLNELEITQESHYYPFGMNHLGPWYETVAPENKYLYNGKELNGDYEIHLMDYGARWYDGAIGRFTTVDPLAETFSFQSPFAYAANNPVSNIDIFGMAPSSTEDLIASVWAQGTGTYDNTGRRIDNNDEESTEEDCCPGLGIGGAQARSQNAQAIAKTKGEEYENTYLELSDAEAEAGIDGAIEGGLFIIGEWALVKAGKWAFKWVRLNWASKSVIRSLDDLATLRGAKWEEVEKLIPEDWIKGALKKGEGVKYVNPHKKGEQILLEKGWPGAKDPLHSGPYIKISRNGNVTRIPLKGNPALK